MTVWKDCTLGDVVTFQRGHDLPKSEVVEGPFPIAGSNGIIGYHHKFSTKAPGITIGRSGNIGNPYFYDTDFWAHNTTLFVKEFKGSDPLFIYYLLKTMDFGGHNSGSAVPSLNRNFIHPMKIRVPESIEEQKAIAKILSAFDDKIEVNRRMNATLEAMARALFKAWFVDFEPVHANKENRPSTSASPEIAKLFPSDFENGIPKGWEVVKLVDVCERITKGTTPKRFTERGINFIKAESLTTDRGFIREKFAVIDDETNTSLLRSQLREDDVLFSIAGTIGRIARVIPDILPANTNQALAIVRANKDLVHPLFIELLLSREEIQHSLTGKTVQAVQANLSLTVLGGTEFPLPPEETVQKVFTVVNSLDAMIKENSRENEVLKQLRDSLLPRLISGRLRVNT